MPKVKYVDINFRFNSRELMGLVNSSAIDELTTDNGDK